MIQMMEKYSNNLEQLIAEKMKEVEEEKKRSDMLLYKMLPKCVTSRGLRGRRPTILCRSTVAPLTLHAFDKPLLFSQVCRGKSTRW